VTTTLTVTTTGVPVVTSDVVLRVPADWPEIAKLHDTGEGQEDAYRALLVRLLERAAPFKPSEDIVAHALALPDPPEIHEGVAEIAFRARQPLGYYDSIIGPWLVESDDGALAFRIAAATPRIDVLWNVNLSLDDGMEIEASRPVPDTAEQRLRQWRFEKGAAGETVRVVARPTQQVRAKLSSGDWRSYLRGASAWLVFMLIPALVIVLGRRGVLGDPSTGRYAAATKWVRQIAVATLVVAAAQLVLFTVSAGWIGTWVQQRASETRWYYGFTLVASVEIVAATLAIAFVLPRLIRAPSTLTHLGSAGLGLLVLAASLPLVLAYWPPEEAPAHIPRSSLVLNGLGLTLVLALGTYVVMLAFRAAASLVSEIRIRSLVLDLVVGPKLRTHIPRLSLPPRWHRRWRLLRTSLGIIGAFSIAAYWLLDGYLEFQRVADKIEGVRFSDFLRFFPVELLSALANLLWLLLLLTLVGVLAAAGASATTAILEPRRLAVSLTLGLLLAGWTIRLGGMSFGFAVPFPAVVTMLAVAFFTRHHLDDRREAIDLANPEEGSWKPPRFGDKAFRAEMLARARAIAAVRRQKGTLYGEYRERKKTEGEYDAAYRLAQEEEAKLRTGGHVVSPSEEAEGSIEADVGNRLLVLPDASPYSFALSLGPRKNWWRNGTLAGALAAPLAVLPLARYGYNYEWPRSGFAPLYVVTSFTFELARWVVAGVVFGCCYAYLPGRVGPIKALALLSAIGLPVALLSLIPRTQTPQGLSSDLLLIGLFLVVVGIVMDWLTLRERAVDPRHLGDLYELHYVRKAAALAPFALGILVAANKIAGGEWGDLKDLFTGILDLITSL
jgi:hypothetical protein